MLLRLRSGKTAALVIALGFGGGTLLLGIGSAALGSTDWPTLAGAAIGYALGALPFFVLAALVAICKTELWFVPEARAFRLLTFRPWRLQPRIEEAPLVEYAGVRTDAAPADDGGGVLVSLVAQGGDVVPMRQFDGAADAERFAERLASAASLWVRHGVAGEPPLGEKV